MKHRKTEIIYTFLGMELLVLNSVMLLVAWYDWDIEISNYQLMSLYFLHGNLSWVITFLAFSKKNIYYLKDSFVARFERMSIHQLGFYFFAIVIAHIIFPHEFSWHYFIEYSLEFYVGKLVLFYMIYKSLKIKQDKKFNTTQAAIIGVNETGHLLRRIIDSNPILRHNFIGYIGLKDIGDPDVIGHHDDLAELIDRYKIQVIYCIVTFFNDESTTKKGEELIEICTRKGVRLHYVPQNLMALKNPKNTEWMKNIVVINPQSYPLDDAGHRLQKRIFDVIFSLLALVFVFSWLFPIIALLIKLDSKGPVFFKQERTCINNKDFDCLKFRTMKVNDKAHELQATSNDPRITRLGRFLRRTNIDEFPQFINVLFGKMSVVGPRPHMLKHTTEYAAQIDYYLTRHFVKPGITGWAQVRGFRGETRQLSDMEKRVMADMEYIENWHLLWDIKITWLTLFGRKAWLNAV